MSSMLMGRRQAAVALATVVVAALVVAALVSPTVQRQLALSFTRQPTSYTELYFRTDPPLRATTAGHATLSFTLANHEAATTTYSWVVNVVRTGDQGRPSTTLGSATLPVGATQTVETPVALPTDWLRVVVILLDRPESLSYLHRETP